MGPLQQLGQRLGNRVLDSQQRPGSPPLRGQQPDPVGADERDLAPVPRPAPRPTDVAAEGGTGEWAVARAGEFIGTMPCAANVTTGEFEVRCLRWLSELLGDENGSLTRG